MPLTLGIVRRVDQLGRVVLPADVRRAMGIEPGDLLEISVDEQRIVVVNTVERCVFCESTDELVRVHDRPVCKRCAEELSAG